MKNRAESIEVFFERMFKEHYSQLLVYASKYTSCKSQSKDIVQDVFLDIWRNRYKINFEERPIRPYLFKAVRNRCLNQLTSVKNNQVSYDESLTNEIQQILIEEDPLESLLYRETSKAISDSISSLPDRAKEVFMLSRKQNKKNKEIANILDISEKAVEKHMTTALRRIREYLYKIKILP